MSILISFFHFYILPKTGEGCNFMIIYFLINKLYTNLCCKKKKKVPPSPIATYLYIIMTIKDKAVPFSKTSSIKRWSSYRDKSYNTMTSQWSWKVMTWKTEMQSYNTMTTQWSCKVMTWKREMQIPVISRLLNIQNANLCITFTNNNQSVISLEK